jgi:hypothetical protein
MALNEADELRMLARHSSIAAHSPGGDFGRPAGVPSRIVGIRRGAISGNMNEGQLADR